ncbi:hypothetical protein WMF20_48820 [Sorangium sp. So ce834]|uniref:hypothetical protein n=1 Tax=Sorangium sp. So ce834 TaxID=3133321 RepID=UPI003F60546E
MNDNSREYYVLWFRLEGTDRYLLWYSDDTDGVWMNEGGKIPAWSSQERARSFASARGLPWKEEKPKCHDLDEVESFVHSGAKIDANDALIAWNLFIDITNSVGDEVFRKIDEESLALYDALFHASGTLPGDSHIDIEDAISADDLLKLRSLLRQGLLTARRYIEHID